MGSTERSRGPCTLCRKAIDSLLEGPISGAAAGALVSTERAAGILLRAACEQAYSCLQLGLKCIDPPLLTSGMLRRYGLASDHSVASFWKLVERLAQRRYCIYRDKDACFRLALHHTIENAYKLVDHGVYVDRADCSGRSCVVAPHAHVLRAYLEGSYEGSVMLKANVVWLLKMLCGRRPRFCRSVEALSEDPFNARLLAAVAVQALEAVKEVESMLSSVLSTVPSSLEDLLEASPILRRALKAAKEGASGSAASTAQSSP